MANTQDFLPYNRATHGSAGLIAAGVLTIAAVALLWYLFDVLLLIFAAALLAVLISVPTSWIAQRTGLRDQWALSVVLLLAALLLALAGWALGAAVTQQFQDLSEQLPKMVEQARSMVNEYGWFPNLEAALESRGRAFLGRGLHMLTATFGVIANVLLVLFMAVLFAAQPDLYIRGSLQLLPASRRTRARQVLSRIGVTMRRWLLGQLLLMVFVGVCSTLGLVLLNVPYALALGLLAGLLTFIPFVGPLVAAAMAILVSLSAGFTTALWVTLLYIGIQAIEGVLEPLVQQRAVYLPPVLLIVGQLALGVLVGLLGVILAAPLTAVLMVAVQMLYVQDVLGSRTHVERAESVARIEAADQD